MVGFSTVASGALHANIWDRPSGMRDLSDLVTISGLTRRGHEQLVTADPEANGSGDLLARAA